MGLIKSVRGFSPRFGANCFLADTAAVIGDVVMGDDCSVWFSAVVRGDVNSIRIGNRVNIQDGSVLHTLYQKSTIEISDNVSIGHNVCVHGARIDKETATGTQLFIRRSLKRSCVPRCPFRCPLPIQPRKASSRAGDRRFGAALVFRL